MTAPLFFKDVSAALPDFNIDFTCPLLNVIEQMAKIVSPGSCARIDA